MIQTDRRRWDYKHQVLATRHMPPWRVLLWFKFTEMVLQCRPRAIMRCISQRDRVCATAMRWYTQMGRRVWPYEILEFSSRPARARRADGRRILGRAAGQRGGIDVGDPARASHVVARRGLGLGQPFRLSGNHLLIPRWPHEKAPMNRQQRRTPPKQSAKQAAKTPSAKTPSAKTASAKTESASRGEHAGHATSRRVFACCRRGSWWRPKSAASQALAIDAGHADSLHLMGLVCLRIEAVRSRHRVVRPGDPPKPGRRRLFFESRDRPATPGPP